MLRYNMIHFRSNLRYAQNQLDTLWWDPKKKTNVNYLLFRYFDPISLNDKNLCDMAPLSQHVVL